MPQYVLKVLVDIEARDDLEARQVASAMVTAHVGGLQGIRDLVLLSTTDKKSIHLNPDGTFDGQWNKGGASRPAAG